VKLLSIFVLLLAGGHVGSGQQVSAGSPPLTAEIRCVYRFTYQPDSLNQQSAVSETAFLFIGKQESEYTTQKNLQMDSTMRTLMTRMQQLPGDRLSVAGLPVTGLNYRIYKRYGTPGVTTFDRIDVSYYRYPEPAALAWELLPARQVVAGYACQQARVAYAGRRWEAWFTREVPVPDGPYKFGGLPGLVVQLADTRGHYTFALQKVQRLAHPLLVPGSLGSPQETTRARFRQAWLNHRAAPFAAWEREGLEVTEADRQRQHNRLQRRNNPLELE
jgi:GLPGLI family protein